MRRYLLNCSLSSWVNVLPIWLSAEHLQLCRKRIKIKSSPPQEKTEWPSSLRVLFLNQTLPAAAFCKNLENPQQIKKLQEIKASLRGDVWRPLVVRRETDQSSTLTTFCRFFISVKLFQGIFFAFPHYFDFINKNSSEWKFLIVFVSLQRPVGSVSPPVLQMKELPSSQRWPWDRFLASSRLCWERGWQTQNCIKQKTLNRWGWSLDFDWNVTIPQKEKLIRDVIAL